MLGGRDSQVGQALAKVRSLEYDNRQPIKVDPALIKEIITSVEIDEKPKGDENEIDLDDSDSESEEVPMGQINMSDHLQSLLNKMDDPKATDSEPTSQERVHKHLWKIPYLIYSRVFL